MINRKLISQWVLICLTLFVGITFGITESEISRISDAMPDKPVVQPKQPRTLLVFSLCRGFPHGCIPYWDKALDIMGKETGAFSVVYSTDMNVFTADKLKQFDAICFNNTTKLTPNAPQQQAILDFIKSGKGIVGIHAATDNFYEWPEGQRMMGGTFTGHPWTAGGTWAVRIDEPGHPLTKPFQGKGFKINDEIYRTAPPVYSRKKQRVLMSLDMSDPTTKNAKGVKPEDADTGITWIKRVGKGRLFYCSLGHNNHLTWNTPVLEHYLAGIQYAMGDLKVDDSIPADAAAALDTKKLDALIAAMKTYDWSASRASLVQLETLIKGYYSNPDVLKQIELKLVKTLDSDIPLAAKDFVCRQLRVIGTEASVETLLKMLDDPETANLGRYALEDISSSTVDAGLLKKLDTVSDTDTKIGIITTLGMRKKESTVLSMAEKMMTSGLYKDDQCAEAMFRALGYTGTEKTARRLQQFQSLTGGTMKVPLQQSLLMCADSLNQTGNYNAVALKIYDDLYKPSNVSVIRSAALIGLIKVGNNPSMLKEALQSLDPKIQQTAASCIASVQDKYTLTSLASMLKTLPDTLQIQVLTALSENAQKVGRPEIEQLLMQTDNKDVRKEAYQALSEMGGDGSTAVLLARCASNASDRDEKKMAQEALYRLSGEDVDRRILNQITLNCSPVDESVMIELIKAAAQRPVRAAYPMLLKMARCENAKIASESIRSLQALATAGDVDDFVDLLIDKPGSAAENLVLVTAEKIEDRNSWAKPLLEKYGSAGSQESKVSMLRVMGKLGDQNSAGLLEKEYASDNLTLREAAFRAMTDWPGSDFMPEMKTLAQSGEDAKTRILAFRAYVRSIRSAATETGLAETVNTLIEAFSLAQRPDEQKIIIGALGDYPNSQSLEFVRKQLDAPALKAEAEVSLVKISEKLLYQNPAEIRSLLQAIEKTTKNESVKKQVNELLGKLVGLADQVVAWKVSGPYSSEGVTGNALFDHAFEPEQNIDKGTWKNAKRLVDKNGICNLKKLSNADNQVAYLKTAVSVDKAAEAVFGIGSDDGVKIWLNGKLVHSNNATRAVKKAEDTVKVSLLKGQNQVLVKVVQYAGQWGFCMGITDTDGKEISGLEVDSDK